MKCSNISDEEKFIEVFIKKNRFWIDVMMLLMLENSGMMFVKRLKKIFL